MNFLPIGERLVLGGMITLGCYCPQVYAHVVTGTREEGHFQWASLKVAKLTWWRHMISLSIVLVCCGWILHMFIFLGDINVL